MHRRPATSLVDPDGLTRLSGQPVAEVSRATLEAGKSLVATWTDLEPIVKQLTANVQKFVTEQQELDVVASGKLLATCASVIQKLSMASTGVLRASEGMAKLAMLLDVHNGTATRRSPAEQSQKQLIAAVVGTVRKLVIPGKQCPACHVLVPLPVEKELDA